MIIKKYTFTDWMKGKNFVLTGLGMNFEKDDSYVSELIEKAGGVIRSSTVLDTDYLIYDPDHGIETTKYKRAKELNQTKGKNIQFLTVEQFDALVNDKEKGKEETITVGSVFCLLEGDQTKCWVQNLRMVYSSMSLEEAKLIFEIHNIASGEYARAAQDDFDTSYSGLFGLDDEIVAARQEMKSHKGINKKFLKSSSDEDDERLSYEEIIASNPDRYAPVKKYFADLDEYDHFDFEVLPVQSEQYYWIDLCRVSRDEYERYTSELHHVYNVVELFDPDDIPFDLNDPATVSIFGTNKFKAFADLSYGC